MNRYLALVVLFSASIAFAKMDAQKLPKDSDSATQCSIFDDKGRGLGDVLVFIKDAKTSDVQFNMMDIGIEDSDRNVLDQDGVIKISSIKNPSEFVTVDLKNKKMAFSLYPGAMNLANCHSL